MPAKSFNIEAIIDIAEAFLTGIPLLQAKGKPITPP